MAKKKQPQLAVEYMETDALVPYANNAKLHSELQVKQIASSIREFGFNDPVGVWTRPDGALEIVEGHGRVMAAKRLKMETVPVVHLDHLTDEERRAYTHVHNQTTLNSGFDPDALAADFAALDFDWEEFGFDVPTDLGGDGLDSAGGGSLIEQFGFVPFSVVRGDSPRWIERSRVWLGLGIRSEIGREGGLAYRDDGLIAKQTGWRK